MDLQVLDIGSLHDNIHVIMPFLSDIRSLASGIASYADSYVIYST